MTGRYNVRVANAKVRFEFEIRRNITVVRGDSGTGKTTLFEMIAEHTRLSDKSGVSVVCDVPCVALVDLDWQNQLRRTSGSIVFIDEGADYTATEAFAHAIKDTDNYYVFFMRENLHMLPYSVKEIYRIRTSGKFHRFEPVYREEEGCVYGIANPAAEKRTILTEDTGAGYQFFLAYCEGSGRRCDAAGANSSVFSWLERHRDEPVTVIADGAAFGAEMDRVMKLQKLRPDQIRLCLPESFEWMILRSGLIKTGDLEEVLDHTVDHADSKRYFSWERFFADYLVTHTADTPFRYQKSKINSVYLIRRNSERITGVIAIE